MYNDKMQNIGDLFFNAIRKLTDDNYTITIRSDKDFDIEWENKSTSITKKQILDKRAELESE